MSRRRRITTVTIAGALGVLAAAPAAHADTVTLGSTLQNHFQGGISTGPTLTVQLSYAPATSPNPVVSPANGVITGWKVKSADDGALYTLKVLRPNGQVSLVTATNSSFSALRSVVAPTPVPAGTELATPTGVIFSYPASLPISKGDYVGVLTGGQDDHVPQFTTSGVPTNLIANNFLGLPADGAAADLLADEQHDLLLQATVRFCEVPGLKGLKVKAAKQALAAADCGVKVSKKKVKKKKQRGRVIKQKRLAGFTAAPGTQIHIVVGKKVKRAKK
jgi:hypothetical protein